MPQPATYMEYVHVPSYVLVIDGEKSYPSPYRELPLRGVGGQVRRPRATRLPYGPSRGYPARSLKGHPLATW